MDLEKKYSPEIMEKLGVYVSLLQKWNQKINLISHATEHEIWQRHILDSAQLHNYLPDEYSLITDFGSGAGFPGLVLAIVTNTDVRLIESNNKKCSFMREVIRETGCNAKIYDDRIENIEAWPSDVITARALAPLDKLLELTAPFITKNTVCLFLKGKTLENEMDKINAFWRVTETHDKSIVIPEKNTDQGWVLKLTDIERL